MKKFKGVILSILLCTSVFVLAGCGSESPSDVVSNYFNELKKGENSQIYKELKDSYKDDELANELDLDVNIDALSEESILALINSFKNTQCTIISETVDGDNAVVSVNLNSPNIPQLLSDVMLKSISIGFTQIFSSNEVTEDSINSALNDALIECVQNITYNEKTGDISLTQIDGKWQMSDKDDLMKLFMAN